MQCWSAQGLAHGQGLHYRYRVVADGSRWPQRLLSPSCTRRVKTPLLRKCQTGQDATRAEMPDWRCGDCWTRCSRDLLSRTTNCAAHRSDPTEVGSTNFELDQQMRTGEQSCTRKEQTIFILSVTPARALQHEQVLDRRPARRSKWKGRSSYEFRETLSVRAAARSWRRSSFCATSGRPCRKVARFKLRFSA